MPKNDDDATSGLKALDKRIRAARDRRGDKEPERPRNEALGAGLRIAVELAAAVLIGAAAGILLDRWLGTTPWLLIVFFILGCAAGLRNVIATARELDRRAREQRRQGVDDPSGPGGSTSDNDRNGQG